MRISLKYYTANQQNVDQRAVALSLAVLDFEAAYVSKTVGPMNYFEINQQLRATGAGAGPDYEFYNARYTTAEQIAEQFALPNVLTVSLGRSARIAEMAKSMEANMPGKAFICLSSTLFDFGPVDLTEDVETDGEEAYGLNLVAVAYAAFEMSFDDFPGTLELFNSVVAGNENLQRLFAELQEIFGPMTMRIEVY